MHTSETKLKMRLARLGKTPWNKGGSQKSMWNDKHFAWMGDKVSYRALHSWVGRKLGKALICLVCGSKGGRIRGCQWARLDHNIWRNLSNFVPLCAGCHRRWDHWTLAINLFEWKEAMTYTNS